MKETFNCKTDCELCEYKRTIKAQDGWEFTGCYHAPYKGKILAEIKECPKTKEEIAKETIRRKEKVSKGLEYCVRNASSKSLSCWSCPYCNDGYCRNALMKDMYALIKGEQYRAKWEGTDVETGDTVVVKEEFYSKCSNCGYFTAEPSKYCPNCGLKMF